MNKMFKLFFQVYELDQRLKMSTDELKTGLFIVKYRDHNPGEEDPLKFYKHLLAGVSGKEPKTKFKICELLKYKGLNEVEASIKDWDPPRFPVNGQVVLSANVQKGPMLGIVLNELRKRWVASDFLLTRDELVLQIPGIIEAEKERT